MIKVYLLLRNNKQSGPYSLEEIAEQHLKPLDLVWIEGRSAAWRYASEISELAVFLPNTAQPVSSTSKPGEHDAYLPKTSQETNSASVSQPKKIHVSLPANAQPKKETPKRREPAPAVQQTQEPVAVPAQPIHNDRLADRLTEPKEKLVTKYSSTLEEKEEAYTEWIYKSKSKKNTLAPEWIGGIAVIILLMMGSAAYYLKNKTIDKAEITQSTPADARAVEELTSTQPEPEVVPDLSLPATTQEAPASVTPPVPAGTRSEAVNVAAPVKTSAAKQLASTKSTEKPKLPAVQNTAKNSGIAVKEESKPAVVPVEEPVVTSSPKTSKTSTPEAEPAKQKKTFSEKVGGFFNKVIRAKKVEPGAPAGSTEPVPTEGERKATRRGETPAAESEPAKKDLSAGIQITTIESSNTWMQGVHGLRMKVENKNDVRISNASVEVKYLNDQNAVIEKKTIRLASIAPGKQITMDIPDHRLADHATASLVSAGN